MWRILTVWHKDRPRCNRTADSGTHQAKAGERGVVGMPFLWQISFETRSNSWISVGLR